MAHDSVPASVKIAPPPEELERPALVENNRSLGWISPFASNWSSTPMQMAVSGQIASPSSLARRVIHSSMQLSGAVTALPPLSRTALRIMKSPTATGTRSG